MWGTDPFGVLSWGGVGGSSGADALPPLRPGVRVFATIEDQFSVIANIVAYGPMVLFASIEDDTKNLITATIDDYDGAVSEDGEMLS